MYMEWSHFPGIYTFLWTFLSFAHSTTRVQCTNTADLPHLLGGPTKLPATAGSASKRMGTFTRAKILRLTKQLASNTKPSHPTNFHSGD